MAEPEYEPRQGQHSFYLLGQVKRSLRNTGEGCQADSLGLWGRELSGVCGIHASQTPNPVGSEGSLGLAPKSGEARSLADSGSVSKDRNKAQVTSPGTWAVTPTEGGPFFPKVEAAGRVFPKGETPVPKMPATQAQGTTGKAPGGPSEAQLCQ